MARRSKIVGFSLPPEVHKKVESLIKKNHKTRSEFFRGMIDVYLNSLSQKNKITQQKQAIVSDGTREHDLAKILKSYWLLKSQTKLDIITVAVALIINDKGQILIGERKAKDKWVNYLTWVFPGGRLESLDFEKEIQREIKEETGLDVHVNTLVDSRIHPDSGFKRTQIVILYFYCTPQSKNKPKPGGDLKKLKWVKPSGVFGYFTTSTSDEVTKFLHSMEKGG